LETDHLLDGLFAVWRVLRRAITINQGATLTLEQFWLLHQLRQNGPLSVGELSSALGVTPGSVTIACKRLEKDGHVTRDRQVHDERVVHVALTPEAHTILEVWLAHRREVFAQFLERLEPQEQEQLMQFIERILEVANSSTEIAEL
jgi:MarR family transcriptional regulator, organic hydroperoxide resistance regulator